MTVGERVTKLLDSKNFSKKYIEEHSSIKDETVRNYQNDVSPPKFVFVGWLFQEFPNLNPQWLFFGTEPQFLDLNQLTNQQHEQRIKQLEAQIKIFQTALNEMIKVMQEDVKLKEEILDHIDDLDKR